jgi:hypothetical protein
MKMIDKAASTAVKVYKAVESIIKAIRAHLKESVCSSKVAKTM